MFELYKKEIATFFCSATGYLVIGVFLILTWLLLWVIPSEFNLIYGGYVSLAPLFDVAPWIYLFLVPAISMRLISEERKLGTWELLLIRPTGLWKIIFAKYLAGLSLVILSIIPTIMYAVLLANLASEGSYIDLGGTAGCYIALVLLAATYMSVGIFASSLTDNQIVAFVVAAALCAMLYVGFDMLGLIAPQSDLSAFVSELGIASHYSSVSRGVVDSRDIAYFISISTLFLLATVGLLSKKK